jgi:type IV secretion system protein VirB8
MSDKPDPIESYLEEGRSWAEDRAEIRARSERCAWAVAIVAICVAVLEALAIVGLTPLKTVVPYTLLVDRQTGYVQALKPLDPQRVSDDTALTQSFLTQYVIAREGYDYDAVRSDYQKVGLWSTGEARQSYVASMQSTNADSPLLRYPRSTTIDVTIKSVSSLSKGVALVRYTTERRDAGGPVTDQKNWAAVIRFGYSSGPLSVADRMINPLGFQVSRYRRSYETIPAVAPVTPLPVPAQAPNQSMPQYQTRPANGLPSAVQPR